ncbi:MAG TPA: YgjV family protein [Gemmatimonadales bacterium]|nr:YgjV family protein [Gemmatimonadales bacterium]
MTDAIGWLATAAFVSSYFWRDPKRLRRVQGIAALLWVAYGVMLHALPVIVANIIVAGVAIASSLTRRPAAAAGSGVV